LLQTLGKDLFSAERLVFCPFVGWPESRKPPCEKSLHPDSPGLSRADLMLKFHPISSELSVYCVKVKRIINDLEPKNSQLIKALCWEMKIFCLFEGFI